MGWTCERRGLLLLSIPAFLCIIDEPTTMVLVQVYREVSASLVRKGKGQITTR